MMTDDRADHVVAVAGRREQLTGFARCIDHIGLRVSYITTEPLRGSVPSGAVDVGLVRATDDVAAVRTALAALADRRGRPSGIVALTDDELATAALLREEWNCPGLLPADLPRLRDRREMRRAVAAAGLPVPAFAEVEKVRQVTEFGAVAGWPLVLEPRMGGSTADGVKAADQADLDGIDLRSRSMMVRTHNPLPLYHVDGVFTGERLARWRVSRYLGGFQGFRTGTFRGSVEVDDAELAGVIAEHALRFLSALTSVPMPFHIELFFDVRGRTSEFLEAGVATGETETSLMWRELHSSDLQAMAVRLQLGLPIAEPEPEPEPAPVGGWLLVPAPAERPCRVTAATSMLGREPGPYAETVLRPGDVLPGTDADTNADANANANANGNGNADAAGERPGGRFRFRGASTAEVEEAIAATAAAFRIDIEPVGSNGRARRAPRKRDYSRAILPGHAETDYARYMKTDTLLSLQRRPSEMVHRDELLFQTVHQSTELWLKHACYEADEAADRIRAGDLGGATLLLARGALGVELITSQLEMLRHLAPWSFQTLRTVLGNGSGFESPGWREVQVVSKRLDTALRELLDLRGLDLAEIYRGDADTEVYRLAEALIDWDERIALWRTRHYKIAIRVIGHQSIGTKGTDVDTLVKLIAHRFFPALWNVRTELTDTGPMAEAAEST